MPEFLRDTRSKGVFTMKKPVFTGAGVAIITPMYEDGSINFDELGRISSRTRSPAARMPSSSAAPPASAPP